MGREFQFGNWASGLASPLWAHPTLRRNPVDPNEGHNLNTIENPPMAERGSVAATPLLHSVNGACQQLSISRTWLYAEIAAGKIAVAKLGRRTLIPDAELRRYARTAVQS